MKFAMFFIAEYANMITVSALTATLFFGGWDIPFTQWDNGGRRTPSSRRWLTLAAFAAKTGFFLFLFMWVRWTLPRFRYDQLMSLGWSIMLPVALGYIVSSPRSRLGWTALGVSRGVPFSLASARAQPGRWRRAALVARQGQADQPGECAPGSGRARATARASALRPRSRWACPAHASGVAARAAR